MCPGVLRGNSERQGAKMGLEGGKFVCDYLQQVQHWQLPSQLLDP